MEDIYKTIEKSSTGFFKDKGSKFFSYIYPLSNEEEVKDLIQILKKEHHNARHHCYAWRIGTEEIKHRSNDDGEPSSTAGKPILGQLQSFELTNVLLVVVRYFGGTLLGVSGLINAYRNAATDAIQNAEILEKQIKRYFEASFTYNEMNQVMHILKSDLYQIINTDFQEDCRIIFSTGKSNADRVAEVFKDLYKVKIKQIDEP